MSETLRIELDTDEAGLRLRLKTRDGRELINVEYDARTARLFAWDLTTGDDSGPEIEIHLKG